MRFDDYKEKGERRTIVTFDPFFQREDVRGLTDAKVGKMYGLETKTIRAMRRHEEVPFAVITHICHQLQCQPGDILKATEFWYIPGKESLEEK